ncbi:MAG: hypothetical protein M3P18_23680 [Actinomycetota bacterium]|nr:hypothetical protein [Actinomycetota bacterium]
MPSKLSAVCSSLLAGSALVLSMTVPAQAFTPTYGIKECSRTKIEPRRFTILQSCWADAGIYARKSTWRYWDRKRVGGRWARADTKIFQDDCIPDCADGHFHHRAAHVWLTGRGWCKSVHRYVYRLQYIKYVGPDKGIGPNIARWPHGWHWLGCP